MLIGRRADRAASAATSAFARARAMRACACFSRVCVSRRARLLRARLLRSTVIVVLFARAGAAASVDDVDDYVDNNFHWFYFELPTYYPHTAVFILSSARIQRMTLAEFV